MVMSPIRTRYPWNLEKQYAKQINSLITDWNHGATIFLKVYLKRLVNGGSGLKLDDATNDLDWGNKIERQISLLGFSIRQSAHDDKRITDIATKFVRSINSFSYMNVKEQTAIVGLDPISDNALLRNWVKVHIDYNVSLIETMRANYAIGLKNDIYRSITRGGGTGDIVNAIVKRTHMAREHAQLIATDQTGKIISQFDTYRAKSAGAEKYVWRSMEDRRVRPKHRELDGKTFKYNDPHGGDDGQLPGEPIRCRCVAEPVF